LVNSIMLAVFRKDIDREAGDAALNDLDEDLGAGRLHAVDLPWRRTLERATQLSRVHTAKLGTRTLDVLHVASGLELGCRVFVTYDARQATLAKTMGLRSTRP
jgi:predicted nucleic acid-binding protein